MNICPILSASIPRDQNYTECYEEHCAWWGKVSCECVIHSMETITSLLKDIFLETRRH